MMQWHSIVRQPAVLAVGAHHAILAPTRLPRSARLDEIARRPLAVVRMKRLDPFESKIRHGVSSREIAPVTTDVGAAAIDVCHPYDDRRTFGERPKPGFAFAQRIKRVLLGESFGQRLQPREWGARLRIAKRNDFVHGRAFYVERTFQMYRRI